MKEQNLKILCVGDAVANAGTDFLRLSLTKLKNQHGIGLCIVNGENSAQTNGITKTTAEELFAAGADIITTGNHVFKNRDVYDYLDGAESVLRPANYPGECPGKGYTIQIFSGIRVLVMNLSGTLFMESLASPFEVCDKILKAEAGNFDISICDFHAEATAEKMAFARYFDSRLSVIFGTHTHVQTSDITILPQGTGYITDVGFCGAKDSVLGLDTSVAISRFTTHLPTRFVAASGKRTVNYAVFEITPSGKTVSAQSYILDE